MDLAYVMALARKVELFNGLSHEDIQRIFSRGLTVKALKGETLFYKGTIGSQMYVVLGGTVGVYDGKQRIALLKTGDMFGEMAIIDKAPRSGTCVAEEDSVLFVLSEVTFEKLLTKTVAIKILLNMMRTLTHRLRDANHQIAEHPVQ